MADEDEDGEIRDFPHCKIGKGNQSAISGLQLRKSDALGHPAKPPQCIEVMRGFLHVLE